jgi:hypothetical protein
MQRDLIGYRAGKKSIAVVFSVMVSPSNQSVHYLGLVKCISYYYVSQL